MLDDEERVRFCKPPILVGLNNPWSDRPEHVLAPLDDKPNCTGSRILRMIQEYKPKYTSEQFLQDFPERVNLDDAGSNLLYRYDQPRNFVLLGRVVAQSLFLYRDDLEQVWKNLQENPPTFPITLTPSAPRHGLYVAPHPSGLNRWYNDKTNRIATGAFLWHLARIRV